MHGAVTFGLMAFTSLFAIVDPIAAVPVYVALTANEDRVRRKATARRAALTVLTVLCVFAAGGSVLFRFFGITIPAFRVAGGVLLFTIALEMMRARTSTTKTTPEETEEGVAREDVGVVPVGLPLLSGPGAIASATVLSGRAHSLADRSALFVAIVLTAGITWVVLRFGSTLPRVLGQTGMRLIGRIMGLMLAATAAQFVLDGLQEALLRGR